MPLMIENPDAPNIDPGMYTLKIVGVKAVTVNFNNEDTQRLEVMFEVRDDEDWEGERFTDLCSFSDGPRSKLGQLARAAFKTDTLPKPWDAEDLIGKRVRASVKLRDSGFNGIVPDTISAVKGKAKAKAEPAETETDDPFSDEDEDAA